MTDEIPYQLEPQVAQLRAERDNAVAYGMESRVAEIDRQLADLGVKAKAAEERKASAEDEPGDTKRKPPQGRSGKPTAKTAESED